MLETPTIPPAYQVLSVTGCTYGKVEAGSGKVRSPNGDSAPTTGEASSLTGWSSGSRVGQPLSTYLCFCKFSATESF